MLAPESYNLVTAMHYTAPSTTYVPIPRVPKDSLTKAAGPYPMSNWHYYVGTAVFGVILIKTLAIDVISEDGDVGNEPVCGRNFSW